MSILKNYCFLTFILYSFFTVHLAQNFSVDSAYHQIIIDGENVSHITPRKYPVQINNSITTDKYDLTIKADFTMKFVWIMNNHNGEYFDFTPSREYKFNNLLEGTYQILSLYYDLENRHYMMLFYYEIELTSDDTLEIKFEDADKEKTFNLKRIDNSPLLMSFISFSFYDIFLPGGISYSRLSLNYLTDVLRDDFIFRYNEFPPEPFVNEWSIKGKQAINNGDFYILNGEFTNSYSNSIIENNPENYCHANFSYNFPDTAFASMLHVGFYPGFHSFTDDQKYALPLELSVYQDTSANIDLINSKFFNTVELQGRFPSDLLSIKMRLGNNKVTGFTSNDSFHDPIILSETENITFGLTPTYWFGKFANKSDTIQIKNSWGTINGTQLFLSQTNDVLPQYPPKIKIVTKNSLIAEKEINSPGYEYSKEEGYSLDSLRFLVDPDWYRVTVTNDKSEVAKRVASTIATTEFNLKELDKNPPFMKQFQLLAGKSLTHNLNSEEINTIRFIMEDDNQLDKVQLFYKSENDTSWNELNLESQNNLYQTELPLLASGFYQLKIFASDVSQNNLSVLMEPAFLYDNTTSINDDTKNISYFHLYNNYPNPFNPTTIISYNLPETSFVNLQVYDILGREVISLVSKEQLPGIYKVNLDGSKLSSGIFYVSLKTSKYCKAIKIILLK